MKIVKPALNVCRKREAFEEKLIFYYFRVTWDTPVKDLLDEDFPFNTGFRNNNTNLRDLLTHKTGISRNDQVWLLDFRNRNDLLR